MTPLSVGFIGLGDQGRPMATAIAQAGFPLHVWARRPGSLDALTGVPHGRHETLPAFAAAADAVALCVSNDEDVVRLHPGPVVVNHGTETSCNAERLAGMCAGCRVPTAHV
jgi:3-hydroxyisobutyrate dehydrogenase-like beta-hydroxyacid dehydrogenase